MLLEMLLSNDLLYWWIAHLKNRQYSDNTIYGYLSDVKIFLKWLAIRDISDITLKSIEDRRAYLSTVKTPTTSIYYNIKPTLSLSTIQWKLTALKSFLKYINLIYDAWVDYRKIDTKRIKSDYIEWLTDSEFQTFFRFIWDYEKYRINALRMQLLCNIGYTSWLRLSEMLGLTIEDIEKKETRITGKGNKTRRVFFTNSTQTLLNQYLEERAKPIPRTWIKEKGSEYVFISHNSGYDYWNPIKKNTVCEKMKKYSDEIDLWKRITVHTLRHSYATKLLESWMNIREIQELLGHCDIQTTENYCHVLKSNLKNKVNQIFE